MVWGPIKFAPYSALREAVLLFRAEITSLQATAWMSMMSGGVAFSCCLDSLLLSKLLRFWLWNSSPWVSIICPFSKYTADVFFLKQYGHTLSIQIFAQETPEIKKRNETLLAKKLRKREEKEKEGKEKYDESAHKERYEFRMRNPLIFQAYGALTRSSWPNKKVFTWEKLNYHVPTPEGQLRLLHDVYGYVKPGTLTALMGASGAGKTTCLDVLAQRKNIGIVAGDVLVDGRPLDSDFARGTAYGLSSDSSK